MHNLLNYEIIRNLRSAALQQDTPASNTGANWDNAAKMYNEMIQMESNSTARAISLLPITKKDTVVDIGCGPGRLSVPLAKIAKSVTSVDAFGKMLEYTKINAKKAGLKNIKFIQKSWLDEDAPKVIGKHDIVVASRSVGLGNIEKLHKIAKKYVVLMCFFQSSLREIASGFLEGIKEHKASPKPTNFNERMFGYNITFNMLYDMGANPNIAIIDDVYEKDFTSKEEAYTFFKFLGEIPKHKEKIYKANVDKYVCKSKKGFRFERKAKSYVMWWDVRELQKPKGKI